MTAEATGFDKAAVKGLGVTVGQTLVYDIHLTIGSVKNIIEVTSEVPLVEVEQPSRQIR